MNQVETVTKEIIKKGGVLALLYFDIHAKNKELVQQLGAGFVNQIIGRSGVIYAVGEIDEPIGGEEGKNWSSSVAVKVLCVDFIALSSVCLAHSPFTVEILQPDDIRLQISEAQELLGLMSASTGEFKRHIITKVAKPHEIAQMQEDLKKRAELGRKLLEKKEAKK